MHDDPILVTLAEVRQRVDAIRECQRDDEHAHSEEDELWRDVLFTIASGHDEAASLASAALETWQLDFARWYA